MTNLRHHFNIYTGRLIVLYVIIENDIQSVSHLYNIIKYGRKFECNKTKNGNSFGFERT
jgi:hypothetical protein